MEIVIVCRRCSDLSVDVTVVFVIGCVSMDLVQERGRGKIGREGVECHCQTRSGSVC